MPSLDVRVRLQEIQATIWACHNQETKKKWGGRHIETRIISNRGSYVFNLARVNDVSVRIGVSFHHRSNEAFTNFVSQVELYRW